MIRSGRAAIAAVAVATVVGAAAFLTLVLRLFAVAAIVGVAWVVLIAVVALLMRGADPEQLKERSQANQRWMDAWARGMAKASGGWNPRRSLDKRGGP